MSYKHGPCCDDAIAHHLGINLRDVDRGLKRGGEVTLLTLRDRMNNEPGVELCGDQRLLGSVIGTLWMSAVHSMVLSRVRIGDAKKYERLRRCTMMYDSV
jgi:hypothetical protein